MRLVALILLALVGVASIVAGVAFIFWPAALVVFGAFCVAVAFVVEVRDT